MVEREFLFHDLFKYSWLLTHVNNPNWQQEFNSNVDCVYHPVALNICMVALLCNVVRIKAAAVIAQTRTHGKLQRTRFSSCGRMLQNQTPISHAHIRTQKRHSCWKRLHVRWQAMTARGRRRRCKSMTLTVRLQLIAGSSCISITSRITLRKT